MVVAMAPPFALLRRSPVSCTPAASSLAASSLAVPFQAASPGGRAQTAAHPGRSLFIYCSCCRRQAFFSGSGPVRRFDPGQGRTPSPADRIAAPACARSAAALPSALSVRAPVRAPARRIPAKRRPQAKAGAGGRGEVPEWSNGAVSKTGVRFAYRGFESHPLRQNAEMNSLVL